MSASSRPAAGRRSGNDVAPYAFGALALGATITAARYLQPRMFGGSTKSTSQLLKALGGNTDPTNPSQRTVETGAGPHPEEYFGINVFDRRAQRKYIPQGDYTRLQQHITQGKSIDGHLADVVANALMQWSMERGATHYSHWYQPISEHTGQKHDTFLDTARDNETPLTHFSGKQLVMSETDGSSAPNGHLRSTHTARAYLAWDPTSHPYVMQHSTGATLYIPAILFSWKDGQALDEKIPLLRSETALAREALELFAALGEDYADHQHLHMDAGLEQEFFLIDRKHYLRRPDLQLAGRTLQGTAPPRGQELEDNYYGPMSPRFLDAIHDFERECWKLGIPCQTRHKEVAPGQYEIAPKFAPANLGTDRNLIMMQILKTVAHRHGLAALYHEKPFKGINGSGKHNNWSLGSNKSPTLFQPGPIPEKNLIFMLFLAATIRAVDKNGDLMRVAIAGASNDHRLGANEAPPAIVSVYLGDDIQLAVDRLVQGATDAPQLQKSLVDLGIPVMPELKKATVDRNRTSTFAFTSNKFEFRAVGSSQNPSRSNQILNTIVAESLQFFTQEITAEKSKGTSTDEALRKVVQAALKKHQRVVFNGDGYSEEWQIEAKRRGLPNLKTTPEALDTLSDPKNIALFEATGVLSKAELLARQLILFEEYQKKITIEGKTLGAMARNYIIPTAIDYQTKLANAIAAVNNESATKAQQQHLATFTSHLNNALKTIEQLDKITAAVEKQPSPKAAAHYAMKNIVPAMAEAREPLDALETLMPKSEWPFPTYTDMLWSQD